MTILFFIPLLYNNNYFFNDYSVKTESMKNFFTINRKARTSKNLMFLVAIFLFLSGSMGWSQATYFWVGGAAGAWTSEDSWNTALNKSGTKRTSILASDVLIFDGSNIGGGDVPVTGIVTPVIDGSTSSIGQLKLQNAADVVFLRGAAGSSTYAIQGDGTAAADFTIDATSTLKVTSAISTQNFTLQLGSAANPTPTGRILGSLRLTDGGLASTSIRLIDSSGVGSLVFGNGSNLYLDIRSSSSSYAFGSSSPKSATSGIKFESGANFIYQGSAKVYSAIADNFFIFEKGSNLILEATPTNFIDKHYYSNLILRNGAFVTFDGLPYNLDNITINNGCGLFLRTSGTVPVAGNIVNDGNFGSAIPTTSSFLLMDGTTPQSISGTGTFEPIGAIGVANNADVTLNTSLELNGNPTSSILGKLNMQTYTIGGGSPLPTETGRFQLRPAATATSNATLTLNAYTIQIDPLKYSGSGNTANVSTGGLVTGTGIQPNTFIISTSSGSSTITISKPATVTTAALGASITISNDPATLITAHPGGVDGAIITAGTRNFGTGTNYIFNAATVSPFSISSNNATGNVTFNAAASTNKVQNIGGTLTLGSGNLTIRALDTLTITSGNDIMGTPNASKYIISALTGNDMGILRMNNISSAKLFPIGTATQYLPVTLSPSSAMDYAVSVFTGATSNGLPNGTALTAEQKNKLVDAVWTINRITGTGNCIVQTNWPSSLEGAAFSAFGNSSIGLARHTGTSWNEFIGTGDNTANTATATFADFSPFLVGEFATVLPVTLRSLGASIKDDGVYLNWSVENENSLKKYEIERSTNGFSFSNIGAIDASNNSSYEYADRSLVKGVLYYRLKMINQDAGFKYSFIIKVQHTNETEVMIYPNPVANVLLMRGLDKNAAIKIVNTLGQTVLAQSATSNALTLDVSSLRIGIYIIQISGENGKVMSKTFLKK